MRCSDNKLNETYLEYLKKWLRDNGVDEDGAVMKESSIACCGATRRGWHGCATRSGGCAHASCVWEREEALAELDVPRSTYPSVNLTKRNTFT